VFHAKLLLVFWIFSFFMGRQGHAQAKLAFLFFFKAVSIRSVCNYRTNGRNRGALPAFLVIFVLIRFENGQKWRQEKDLGRLSAVS